MLTVKNLKKKFKKQVSKNKTVEFYADNGISFTASQGEIVGILGANGAGKSTLLRMIAGILEPTEGEVLIDELNYKDNEVDIKKRIAFLSGNTKIYNSLSPYELLKMCAELYEVEEKEVEKRIEEISNTLELNKFLHNRIEKLSTGQTQRVSIARCLMHDPKYYILDEATSGLDIISSQIILDFIKNEKKRGKTVLYSTHYMEEAENICDKCLMINEGIVIMSGTPDEIKERTGTTNLRDAFFTLIGGAKDEK